MEAHAAGRAIPDPCTTCQVGIPDDRDLREAIRRAVDAHVRDESLQPQLAFADLERRARTICADLACTEDVHRWVMVLINSRTWHDRLAAIPPTRRLLLLPQCLRHDDCPATIDELGLLCQGCGRCVLASLKAEAEGLGYMVLISEGTAAVMALVKSGKIDGFVGSSCLATLEKVFPLMAFVQVPAIAIPLLRDGCRATTLDDDWLRDAMHLGIEGAEER